MMEFKKKIGFWISFGIAQKIRYVISSNFYLWSISIRVFYQKLWSFKVFSPSLKS